MRVAVTGASGCVGRPLCAALARRGFQVRALVRSPARFDAAPGVETAHLSLPDVLDPAALAGVEVLVHAAYATREPDEGRARRVNEDGTHRLLEVAREAGVARRLFLSTVDARADAPSYYARSKYELEQRFREPGDLVLRPGLVVAREGGRFQEMLALMRRLPVVPLFGGGRQPLQTVHLEDLVEAVVRAVERQAEGALNVAAPEPIALGRFQREAARAVGLHRLFLPVPLGPALALVSAAESVGLRLPVRAESLRALRGLRAVPVEPGLGPLGFDVRSAEQSLRDLAH